MSEEINAWFDCSKISGIPGVVSAKLEFAGELSDDEKADKVMPRVTVSSPHLPTLVAMIGRMRPAGFRIAELSFQPSQEAQR